MASGLALLFALAGQPGGVGLLGVRLLAILAGGACAIAPAALLAPIRTRDLVRRRTAECLSAIRDCLEAHRERRGPDVAAVRRGGPPAARPPPAAPPPPPPPRPRAAPGAGGAGAPPARPPP